MYRTDQWRVWSACLRPSWVHARREINSAGLPGLYRTILATAGPEIKSALEVRPAPLAKFGQKCHGVPAAW